MTCVFIKVAEAMYKLWIATDQRAGKALGEEGAERGAGRAAE